MAQKELVPVDLTAIETETGVRASDFGLEKGLQMYQYQTILGAVAKAYCGSEDGYDIDHFEHGVDIDGRTHLYISLFFTNGAEERCTLEGLKDFLIQYQQIIPTDLWRAFVVHIFYNYGPEEEKEITITEDSITFQQREEPSDEAEEPWTGFVWADTMVGPGAETPKAGAEYEAHQTLVDQRSQKLSLVRRAVRESVESMLRD